ncbi:MAG: transposase [Bifidobacterium breve]|nr:transposase [Bifidobacterium breve]
MREDRRERYDDGFRREALGLIKAGVGYVSLARRLAMPAYTAKQWTMLYRSGGEESFMGAQGSRRYDWETKAAAARDHVDNGLTVTEVMAKYDVASVAPLRRWCREWAEYDIAHSTLHRWVQGIRDSGSTRATDNRTPGRNEPVGPGRRNRQLEMEVDVSERVAPVFARKQA